jgi:hypothetical protein
MERGEMLWKLLSRERTTMEIQRRRRVKRRRNDIICPFIKLSYHHPFK